MKSEVLKKSEAHKVFNDIVLKNEIVIFGSTYMAEFPFYELEHKYLLSNAISTFLRTIIYKNNIENLFDKIYISSEMKLAKPDKKFFLHVLDDINAMPSECIMIDDNPKNIAAAEAVGIQGIVYRGINDLKDKLDEIL